MSITSQVCILFIVVLVGAACRKLGFFNDATIQGVTKLVVNITVPCLMISNMHYIGRCYVDVWGNEVTVSYALLDNSAIRPLSSYGRWFTSLSQITAASIESEADGFTFGQPMSIGDDLGGADTALLFIRCKATYYQPFRDGTALTRYWRNRPEWKEFREGLQELLPRVEK